MTDCETSITEGSALSPVAPPKVARHTPPHPARGWRWPVLVAALFVAGQAVVGPAAAMYPDSARYGSEALQLTGTPRAEAEQRAAQVWCADKAEQAQRANAALTLPLSAPTDPAAVEKTCLEGSAGGLYPSNPRYDAIFTTRPGYPLAVAVLLPFVGMKAALWLVPMLSTLAAGVMVWLLLRAVGLTARRAAAGQALLYLLPVGWWGTQMLTEGPILLGVTTATLGAVLLLRERPTAGVAALGAGLAAVAAVKYSTALPLAAALLVAGLVSGVATWASRRAAAVLTAAAGVGLAVLVGLSRAWRWPGIADTSQDLFALHFTLPDVPNVGQRLIEANVAYWTRWPVLSPLNLALVAGVAAGGWALWRRSRALALVVLGVAAVGAVLTAAHPDVYEGDRLYSLSWLAVVIGLPAAATTAPVIGWREPRHGRRRS